LNEQGRVRIGELSRRTGVSVDVLRAWERRYSLLQPERSGGGQRLYAGSDEQRIRSMLERLAEGLSPAEAARVVARDAGPNGRVTPADLAAELTAALDALDTPRAHATLDRMFDELGTDRALVEVVMPYLRDLGNRWACAEITVAEEHFASRLLNARLLDAARGWDEGAGPRAVLACPPGEEHDLGLISFGIALHQRGWRITYLGANTPISAIADLAQALDARAVVLAAATPVRFADVREQLEELARGPAALALGGAGAQEKLVAEIGARRLTGDPVAATVAMAELVSAS
jgi:DNA-binding transcriptional MerR regulator/methylmalonyl-CoA mutase cobalamin-binding subunit